MAGNNVTLTFAGDSARLESAFDRVGQSARDMGREVSAGADSFDRVGEAADTVDTRAMGFRDTLTGVQDGMEAVKVASKDGWGFEALLLAGFAVGDLASGMFNLLIPAAKSAVTWVRGLNVAAAANAVGSKIAAGAARVWAAGQWLLNAALTANPIGLVIAGIVLLIGIIVLIATKTTWFQDLWRAIWGKIGDPVKKAWDWIKRVTTTAFNWYISLPGKIWNAFKKIGGYISAPFKAAFNAVSRAWNATIGRLSWSVPGWIPGIGGQSISAPRLPTFHTGGVVPGRPGEQVPIMALAGETVVPRGQTGGAAVLVIDSAGSRLDDLLLEVLRRAVKDGGGNVQVVLGGRRTA